FASAGANLLVSLLGHDWAARAARDCWGRLALSDRVDGLASKIFRPVSYSDRDLRVVLALRGCCLDLPVPTALPHQSLLMKKLQDPRSKLQRNIKHQAPNRRGSTVFLKIGIWCFSGAWSLELGALCL